MKSFYDETILRLGLPVEQTTGRKVTVYDGVGVVVEGHGGISEYSPEKIRFRLGGKIFRIEGEKLEFREITGDELFIVGKVRLCEAEDA